MRKIFLMATFILACSWQRTDIKQEQDLQLAWIPQAIMLGTSLLGGLLGNKKQTQTQSQKSTSQNNSSFNNYNSGWNYGENRTNYDPALFGLRNKLIEQGNNFLNPVNYGDPGQLAQSAVTQNIWGANKQADLQKQQLAQALRSRGLGSSTAGAYAGTMGDAGRIQQITQSMNQMPQLQRQYTMENDQMNNARTQLASQLFGMIPKDTVSETGYGGQQSGMSENTGVNQSYGESTTPGNMAAGGLGSLSSMLAYLFGQGAFGKSKSGNFSNFNPNTWSQILSGGQD
jgi:hypothetical protein